MDHSGNPAPADNGIGHVLSEQAVRMQRWLRFQHCFYSPQAPELGSFLRSSSTME